MASRSPPMPIPAGVHRIDASRDPKVTKRAPVWRPVEAGGSAGMGGVHRQRDLRPRSLEVIRMRGDRPPGRFRWTGSVMGRVLRGLGSLAGLLLIMVGIPAGLVWFPGWPLPKHWPHDQATWQQWLDHPINQSSMVDAAACLVWLLWAFSMYMLLADIVARARGVVRRPRLRLAVPLHSAATSLIGTATLAVT